MAPEPEPQDLGYLFPRQFPVWSTRLCTKEGKLVRTSSMVVSADGTQVSDYWIRRRRVAGNGRRASASSGRKKARSRPSRRNSCGWPKLLPEGAEIEITGDLSARGKLGQAIPLTLAKATRLVITGPDITLPPEAIAEGQSPMVPFRAELTLVPEKPGQAVELTVLRGTVPYQYKLTSAAAAAEE